MKMKPLASTCVLVSLVMGLHQGATARKPKMIPTGDELVIREGDELILECQGEGRLQFSTQWNMARVEQSPFRISVDNDSGLHTFTRPNATRVDTGWYGCAEEGVVIQNDEQTIVHPDTEISWIYVYVNSFEWLAIGRQPSDTACIPVVKGRSLVIPCRPTSPDMQVVLICARYSHSNDVDHVFLRFGRSISDTPPIRSRRDIEWKGTVDLPYDPKIGFIITDHDNDIKLDLCKCGKMITDSHGNRKTEEGSDFMVIDTECFPLRLEGGYRNVEGLIFLLSIQRYEFLKMRKEKLWIEQGAVIQAVTGKNLRLTCYVDRPAAAGTMMYMYWEAPESVPEARWRSNNTQTSDDAKRYNWEEWKIELIIYDVKSTDDGEYSCVQKDLVNGTLRSATINVTVLELAVRTGNEVIRVKPSQSATLFCHVVGYPLTDFTWGKIGDSVTNQIPIDRTKFVRLNEFEGTINLKFTNVSRKDNGTYECRARDCSGTISSRSSLIVTEVPQVKINVAKVVGARSVYIQWAADDGNDAVEMYFIEQVKQGTEQWQNISTNLTGEYSSYDIEGLEKNTAYQFRITATNSIGDSEPAYSKWITTMDESPEKIGEDDGGRLKLLAGLSGGSILCIIVFVVVWMRVHRRREMAARRRFIVATLESQNGVAPDCLDPALNMADQAEAMEYDKKWEFPRKLLKFDKVLGSGAFGTVMKAGAKSITRGEKVSTVAVKMVRATHRLDHMMALQRELKILAYLGKHVNVVNLIGACTGNISYGELLVIVEYCRFGNLHDYLRSRRDDFVNDITGDSAVGMDNVALQVASSSNGSVIVDMDCATEDPCETEDFVISSVPVEEQAANPDLIEPGQRSKYLGDFKPDDVESIGTSDLLNWAWQISRGMKFLGIRRVLHGDLATRNILLADNNVVKICDFGLAKSLVTDEIYKKSGRGPLPVKWMAVESIRDRLFSVKSDVWAFGVVLWELFSLAETPYPGIANDSVYQKLAEGFRMAKPKYATDDLYKTMLRCWDAETSKRTSFVELEDKIADLLDEGVKTHYLAFDAHYEELNAAATVAGNTNSSTVASSDDNEIRSPNQP